MSLKIKNLSKKYTKDYIFRDFSYKFDEKGLYLILGKSGVGKTTLLRIIAGIDKNFEGDVIGGGIHSSSFAFQEYRLFPTLSALENVYLEKKENERQAKELLISLGLPEESFSALPSELSGGMKQRVSIARAFFKSAPVLCLDEPTKEIGKDNAARLIQLIRAESEKRLIIVVTHNEEDFTTLQYKKIEL